MSRPEDTEIAFDDEAETWTYEPQPFPLLKWWNGLEAAEQTLFGGLAALGIGLAAIYPPWGLIVPGAVLTGLALVTVLILMLRRP